MTTIIPENMIDAVRIPPPDFLTDRRRRGYEGRNGHEPAIPIDHAALERAMAGGVPAEVERYAPPKRQPVDLPTTVATLTGPFSSHVQDTVRRIADEIETAANALEHRAADLRRVGQQHLAAIVEHARAAASQLEDAVAMAAAFGEAHQGTVARATEIMGAKAAAGPASDPGANAEGERPYTEDEQRRMREWAGKADLEHARRMVAEADDEATERLARMQEGA